MNSLSTRYVGYFNRKYKRVGSLYQGVYKAVLIETTEQLLYATKYIHRNVPVKGQAFDRYPYTSYPVYLGYKTIDWVKTDRVMNEFSYNSQSYKVFVESDEEVVQGQAFDN
jgi:putative transposase